MRLGPVLVALCLLALPIVGTAVRAGVAMARDPKGRTESPTSHSHLLAFPLAALALWYIATHLGR